MKIFVLVILMIYYINYNVHWYWVCSKKLSKEHKDAYKAKSQIQRMIGKRWSSQARFVQIVSKTVSRIYKRRYSERKIVCSANKWQNALKAYIRTFVFERLPRKRKWIMQKQKDPSPELLEPQRTKIIHIKKVFEEQVKDAHKRSISHSINWRIGWWTPWDAVVFKAGFTLWIPLD